MADLQELHRRALLVTVDVVNQVSPGQLRLPTPCSEWDLGQLLAHMTGQNHGFAAAARGETKDESVFEPREVDADPAGLHAASAADLAAAFAQDGFLQRTVWLPEISIGPNLPGATAVGFHLVDSVAHGWDVAEAIGAPIAFDLDVLSMALRISRQVPDGAPRLEPGSAFGPGVEVPAGTGPLDEILGLLGRSPQWRRRG